MTSVTPPNFTRLTSAAIPACVPIRRAFYVFTCYLCATHHIRYWNVIPAGKINTPSSFSLKNNSTETTESPSNFVCPNCDHVQSYGCSQCRLVCYIPCVECWACGFQANDPFKLTSVGALDKTLLKCFGCGMPRENTGGAVWKAMSFGGVEMLSWREMEDRKEEWVRDNRSFEERVARKGAVRRYLVI